MNKPRTNNAQIICCVPEDVSALKLAFKDGGLVELDADPKSYAKVLLASCLFPSDAQLDKLVHTLLTYVRNDYPAAGVIPTEVLMCGKYALTSYLFNGGTFLIMAQRNSKDIELYICVFLHHKQEGAMPLAFLQNTLENFIERTYK